MNKHFLRNMKWLACAIPFIGLTTVLASNLSNSNNHNEFYESKILRSIKTSNIDEENNQIKVEKEKQEDTKEKTKTFGFEWALIGFGGVVSISLIILCIVKIIIKCKNKNNNSLTFID